MTEGLLFAVAAGMVTRPNEYKWSSYLINAWGGESNLIRHDEYLKLGCDVESRCYAYRELFKCQLSDQEIRLIENASDYCHPVSDDRFRQQIEKKYNIKLGQSARGRPKKLIALVKK